MSGEILYSINFALQNPASPATGQIPLKHTVQPDTITVDQATQAAHATVVTVGTSEETMPTGDVAAASQGMLIIANLDTTNYVTYGPDSSGMVALGKIEPGEVHILRLSASVTMKWQANVADVKVQMWLMAD